MITCAIARASTPSVPGLAAIHSSAFMPVSDRRGPTYTNFAIDAGRPASNACARAKPFWNSTGESHVSRKSAPKDSRYFAFAKSYVGNVPVPNAMRLPARSASNPKAS